MVVHHLCPWGMREAFTSLLTKDKCKTWNVLPVLLRQALPKITSKDNYKSSDWVINVSHTGPSPPQLHYQMFCNHCQYVLIPKLIDEFREGLSDSANIDGVIAMTRKSMPVLMQESTYEINRNIQRPVIQKQSVQI